MRCELLKGANSSLGNVILFVQTLVLSSIDRAKEKAKELAMAIQPSLKGRGQHITALTRWVIFCWTKKWSDLRCNEKRLSEYVDYSIVNEKSQKGRPLSVVFWKVAVGLSQLWVVWDTPDTSNEAGALKNAAKPFVERAKYRARKDGFLRTRTEHGSGGSRKVAKPWDLNEDPAYGDGPCGRVIDMFTSLTNRSWRLFSCQSDILLNCILLRRSSYSSLEMRLWHLFSASTWLDSEFFRDGVRLGSLSLRNKRSLHGSSPQSYITVIAREKEQPSNQAVAGNDKPSWGSPYRGKAGSSEYGGRKRLEMFRHRVALQCPWNALAILLYYKWHILKEPPPDFEDPSWADQPLFGNYGSADDAHLEEICGELYREYDSSIFKRQSTFKHIRKPTHRYLAKEMVMDRMLQGAITSANTMYVTSGFLQLQTFEAVQIRNSGFNTHNSPTPYGVQRQQYSVPSELERTIFPFAETILDYDPSSDDPDEMAHRDTISGFCSMLKVLRTVLIQDMAIMFDVPFYRRMLQGSALMCSETFQRPEFMEFSEEIRNKAWDSDFLPLVEITPRHPILAQVRSCPTVWTGTDQLAHMGTALPEASLPTPNQSIPPTDRSENYIMVDFDVEDQLPIEILDSPPQSPSRSTLLTGAGLETLEIESISSADYAHETEVQRRKSSPDCTSSGSTDAYLVSKRRRVSELHPDSFMANKYNGAVHPDKSTGPGILNIDKNAFSRITLDDTSHPELNQGQGSSQRFLRAFSDIACGNRTGTNHPSAALHGCRTIDPAAVFFGERHGNVLMCKELGLVGIEHEKAAQAQRNVVLGNSIIGKEAYSNSIWGEQELGRGDGDVTAVGGSYLDGICDGDGNGNLIHTNVQSAQSGGLPEMTGSNSMAFLEYMDSMIVRDRDENLSAIQEGISSVKSLMEEILSNQRDLKTTMPNDSKGIASETLGQIKSIHCLMEKTSNGIESVKDLLEAIRGLK
ncbi:hypothetical protein EV177_007496 [Coemansia sp. RSA 1804]|nr:hypothetical protein EV177_007496 [Coemansia sp. RSA 1804]